MMACYFLAIALSVDPVQAWSEAIGEGLETTAIGPRDAIQLFNEITPSRTVPAGRVDGSRAFIYWPDGIVTPPQLTCLNLANGSLVWKQTLPLRPQTIFFSRGHCLVTDEQRDGASYHLSVRWFDLEQGTLGPVIPLDPGVWVKMIDRRWLLLSDGEVLDAETGKRTATMAAKLQGHGLTVGNALIELVLDSDATGYQLSLRKLDVLTGKRLCHYDLSERNIDHQTLLLAASEERAILLTDGTISPERRLTCVSLTDGTFLWTTAVPPFASIRLIHAPESMVTQQDQQDELARAASLDVDWETGAVTLPTDRPAPLSRFDWYMGPRAEMLGMRLIDRGLIGWSTPPNGGTAVMRIDPATGRQIWSTPIAKSRSGAVWMKELGDAPQYAVFSYPGELNVVDITTGQLTQIRPEKLGLPYEVPSRSGPTSPQSTDELAPVAADPVLSPIRRTILLLAGVAAFGMWIWRFISDRNRPR